MVVFIDKGRGKVWPPATSSRSGARPSASTTARSGSTRPWLPCRSSTSVTTRPPAAHEYPPPRHSSGIRGPPSREAAVLTSGSPAACTAPGISPALCHFQGSFLASHIYIAGRSPRRPNFALRLEILMARRSKSERPGPGDGRRRIHRLSYRGGLSAGGVGGRGARRSLARPGGQRPKGARLVRADIRSPRRESRWPPAASTRSITTPRRSTCGSRWSGRRSTPINVVGFVNLLDGRGAGGVSGSSSPAAAAWSTAIRR